MYIYCETFALFFCFLIVTVSRLIRTSYGDYDLNTIPPGMAIEVPVKQLDQQKKKGRIQTSTIKKKHNQNDNESEGQASPVQWIRHY